MFGGTFALLERSLRVDVRSRSSHVMRLALIGAIYIALSFSYFTQDIYGAPGLQFLRTIAYLDAIFITLLGISFFSSVIAEEKEEGTIGLMLIAGISPLGLLSGKSIGAMWQAILLIAVQYPFAMLAVTMGGVSHHQIFSLIVALVAYIVLLVGLGLFISTITPRSRNATSRMFVIWFVMFFLIPSIVESALGDHNRDLMAGLIPADVGVGWLFWSIIHVIAQLEIFGRIGQILSTGFKESSISIQVVSHTLLGITFFALSRACFSVVSHQQSTEAMTRGSVARSRASFRFPAGRAWVNPFIWKDFYFVSGGVWMIVLRTLFFCALGLLQTFVELTTGNDRSGEFIWISIHVIAFLGAITIASGLSRSLRDEIQGMTLPSLYILPRSLVATVYSKFFGVLCGCVPPIVIGLSMLLTSSVARGMMIELIDEILKTDLSAVLSDASSLFFVTIGVSVWGLFFALIPHLSTVFSTYVRWGAVSLGIGATIAIVMGTTMCVTLLFMGATFSGGNWDAGVVTLLIAMVYAGICVACHFLTIRRLQALVSK